MSSRHDNVSPVERHITCERCGTEFSCLPGHQGACWCEAESYRIPTPLPSEAGRFGDCLCPLCLRKIAALITEAGGR